MDQRIIKLSDMLTSYSCDLQKGDRVLIDYEGGASRPLVCQLIKDCYKLGAKPYVTSRDSRLMREMLLGCGRGAAGVPQRFPALSNEGNGRVHCHPRK